MEHETQPAAAPATTQSILDAATVAKLVDQLAANASAQQAASQTSQQVNQSVADLLAKMSQQTSTQNVASQVLQEETGFGERYQTEGVDRSGIVFSNQKRTYDEYQEVSLESIKRNRSYVDKVLSDAQQFDNQRQTIANQALQNSVETANMVAKQAVRHADIAIDAEWNPVQQGAADTLLTRAVTIDDASLKAIGAAVAAAIAAALANKAA
jgi:hypothetical protein